MIIVNNNNQLFPTDKMEQQSTINNFPTRSNINNLVQTILDATEIVQHHGIQCWLCYGALLGMVREKRLLPWNDDAELGCWYTSDFISKVKLIISDLNKMGYSAYYYSTIGTLSVKQTGAVVNINCFWSEGDYSVRPHEVPSIKGSSSMFAHIFYQVGVFMGVYYDGFIISLRLSKSIKDFTKVVYVGIFRILPCIIRKKLVPFFYKLSQKLGGTFQKTGIPLHFFETLSTVEFYGSNVLVPKNSKKLLKVLYGEEWHIPKDAWSFYKNENKSETSIMFIDEIWDYGQMEII